MVLSEGSTVLWVGKFFNITCMAMHKLSLVGTAPANLTVCLLMLGSSRLQWNNQLLGYPPR